MDGSSDLWGVRGPIPSYAGLRGATTERQTPREAAPRQRAFWSSGTHGNSICVSLSGSQSDSCVSTGLIYEPFCRNLCLTNAISFVINFPNSEVMTNEIESILNWTGNDSSRFSYPTFPTPPYSGLDLFGLCLHKFFVYGSMTVS